MKREEIAAATIKRLDKNENIPYELLVLADPSRALIDKYIGLSEIYVASLINKNVGIYVLYPVSPEVVEVKNISVEDEYQGKGLGTLMLKDATDRARAKGFKKMIIGTGNTSVGQLYLYQKEGFDLTEIKRDFFIQHYPEILYENGLQVKHMLVLTKHL